MHRRTSLYLSAAACCALLAACGGGGDSPSPTPTPTPTGTPTPSPSPTPTPTPTPTDFDFSQAFTDTVANASLIFAYFTPNSGGAEVFSDGSRREGSSTITYAVSPEKVTFTWPDAATLSSFDAADLQTATANLRTYRDGNDGITLELPFEHILRVSYERTEAFVRQTVPGMLRSNRVTLFFNDVTTTAAITTDLTYAGTARVAGGTSGTTPPGAISAQPTTLTVAASDKKITGTIQIVEDVNGTPTLRATLPISATVGGNSAFAGEINDTASGFKGQYVGSLAGPAREEAFVIFIVTHTDGRKFVGSLIAS